MEDYINNNRRGDGYDIKRIASEQKDNWKKQWTKEELQEIKKGYFIFPNELYNFE